MESRSRIRINKKLASRVLSCFGDRELSIARNNGRDDIKPGNVVQVSFAGKIVARYMVKTISKMSYEEFCRKGVIVNVHHDLPVNMSMNTVISVLTLQKIC